MTDQRKDGDMGYTPTEMMIVSAARALSGVRTVFVGVGLPNIACNLARRTGAPDLELIYESGIYGARPARLPLSIGDPTLVTGATAAIPMADLFGFYLQGGRVEVALLGGAQIDRYGNLNTTVIGAYETPTVRLPGSGGACEIAMNARRTFTIMRLQKRAFVEQLDFVTSPGHMSGGNAREMLGMPGTGPHLVVTDKALFDYENAEREMQLTSLYPDVTLDEVRNGMGWEIRLAPTIAQASPPTPDELHLIRVELDPGGMYH
jgi:glutaconate CoA-transferase subunit B